MINQRDPTVKFANEVPARGSASYFPLCPGLGQGEDHRPGPRAVCFLLDCPVSLMKLGQLGLALHRDMRKGGMSQLSLLNQELPVGSGSPRHPSAVMGGD